MTLSSKHRELFFRNTAAHLMQWGEHYLDVS